MFDQLLSYRDRALFAEYERAAKEVGFDGVNSLDPHQRGVLAVAEMVRKRVELAVLKQLGLQGRPAVEFTYNLSCIPVPSAPEAVAQELHARHLGPDAGG